ncbi:ATP-grasp domain-containing protein [Streptomyces iconiensis]|uniref:ATP-grasp domain-containing protein n=1 Tax=Streptomyces iconiensis TaxID=1384038 RepID=A0ABT6ZUK7_9ACTN|nr:ATP-grasp domain-containing protein [Streptomyces iconiensis]MDJ1132741.1 ATP-grasp domain-containing protein [Streptomyces iconiensis]
MSATNSERRRIAVVGGHSHSVMSAKDLGLDVVLVHMPGMYEEMLHDYCERIVHCDLSDADALLDVLRPLHEERPFERVLTTSEAGAVPTAVVVEKFGLPGNSVASVRALYDKALTREALGRAGVSPVLYQVVDGAEALTAFLDTVGGRIVVKPVDGTASAGVHLIDDKAGALAAWESLSADGYRTALAEEFLAGPVISVEAFSADGRHLPVALMTSVLDEYLVEMEHSIPGAYGSEWTAELHAQTVALLTEVGLREGPTHTEFILTPEGPRMLESHSRMGGGGTPSILRRAHGLDFSRMFLSVPLGIEQLPERAPEAVAAGHILFFAPEPGVITGFDGIERLTESGAEVRQAPVGAKLPGVPGLVELSGAETGVMLQMNVGDTVPAIRAGWDRAMGYVIATGKDPADARRRCAEVDATLRFHTAPAGDGTRGA